MSTDHRCRTYVLWITLQQLLVLTYLGLRPTMAISHSTPYVSEFEYASRFHPSKNPDCPTSGWADNSEHNSGAWRYRRSPEEGSPVGQEPSIEVRAILVRCPKTAEETDDILINRNVYNITAGRSQDILDFHGFDRDEPAHHSEVRDCRRKLIITMKFNNIGRTKTQEEFVVIDHVLDPVTMHKARLLNPFVIKVRQEPVLQLYGLKFQGVVNAEAREEVINKKLSNYTGCDDSSDNPTCGQMIFEGKPIPYSQGFCCSCDPELNVQRQASLLNESVSSSFSSFFSKSKDERIRPFKSPRSVNTNFYDSSSEAEETDDLAFPNENKKKESPRSNYESLANSKTPNFDSNENKSLAIDEQDLINLKNARKTKTENRPIWKSIFNEIEDKKTNAPHIVFSPPASFKRRSNSSISSVENLEITEKRKSSNGVFQSSGKEFPIHKSTSLQNLRSVNLAAELSKLEEDYKNLRESNLKKAAQRNKEKKDNEFATNNQNAYLQSTANSEENILRIPLNENFYGRGSTMSIDIKFALIPIEKSSTCSRKTTIPSSFVTETPSVLWQKLFSDKVFRSNLSEFNSFSTPNNKFEIDVADLLADAVKSDDNKNSSVSQENNDRSTVEMYNATFPDSISESIGTTDYSEGTEYPESNNEKSFDRAETSFSSGNHSKDDAILLSGSLKNQLANWFTNEQRNNSELESTKKLEMQVDRDNKVGNNEEVGNAGFTILPTTVGKLIAGPFRHKELNGAFIEHRKPVEVHLSYDPTVVKENKQPQRNRKVSQNFNSEEMKFFSRNSNAMRSYRSIAEDDSVFAKDNDRQRSIDKQIEDEFEEISDALKEAADLPKVMREKPKSESTFEEDNSIARKFAKMFQKNLREKNNLGDSDEKEVQTEMSKHTEGFVEPVEIVLSTNPQIIVDRFKLINDFKEVPADLQKESSTKISNLTNVSSEILETTKSQIIVDRFPIAEDLRRKAIHNLGHEKRISVSNSKGISINNNAPLSPFSMIENLKKELRKEAELYSSMPRSTIGETDFKEFSKHSGAGNEVREINTELTPAERVEDLITDEETLPPDEETKYTTDSLSKSTSEINKGTSSIEAITINDTVFPRLSIQSFDAKFINDNHALPMKRAKKILILVEDQISSSPKTLRNKRKYKRKNHHDKRSIVLKSNIGNAMTDQTIVKGKNENEDDEHPWYETTVKSEMTNAKVSEIDETVLVKSTTLAVNSLQNRKRRFYIETNPQRNESSNERRQSSTNGNFHLFITKIPQNDFDGSKAGLRIEEITKNKQQESPSTTDSIEEKLSSVKWIENSGEVDEMPIFRDTKNRTVNNLFRNQIRMERSKRNLQNSSNNKRNDVMNFDDNEPKGLIFYDYEDNEAEKSADSEIEEKNGNLNLFTNEKSLRFARNNDEESISKDSNRQMMSKRKSAISRNHRVNGRSNFFRKEITTESSDSLDSGESIRRNKFGIEPSDGWKEKMELLKLKKHADVLKEYLNWRQDVALPEIQGVPGYTTRISLTDAKEEQITDFFTSDNLREGETLLPSSTMDSTSLRITNTDEQRTDSTEFATTKDENYPPVNVTTGSSETLEILQSNNSFGNCSSELLTTTVEVQTSTGCPDNKTEGNFTMDDETSTGRILPPCGYQNGCLTTSRTTTVTPNGISDVNQPHQEQLSDLDKDLIIISVLEKNRQFDTKKHEVHNEASAPILQHRRRHHKSRNNKKPIIHKSEKIRHNRRGRKLMSLENYEENDIDSNEKDTFNGEVNDNEWNKKWNKMIDKIIHENSSNSWKSENASNLAMKEIDKESHSAMQQLHFNNADKYIRQIAKKIVHNTNIHEPKHRIFHKSKSNHRKPSSRRHRPAKNQIFKRKLQSYPSERRKVLRKAENSEDSGNYDDKRSAAKVESKTNDFNDQKNSYPAPRNAETNATSTRQISEQEKIGRDFAISLNGKIHVEGGTNGQPMSISFDTSPNISNSSDAKGINTNGSSKFENANKTDGETGSNFLSSLFNIASVPKDLTNHPLDDKNSSSNTSIRQVDERMRESRENRRFRKYPKIRKSRAVDDDFGRNAKNREGRSFNFGELEDIDEENEEDYPEASNDENYSDEMEYGESDNRRSAENEDLRSPDIKLIKIIPVNSQKLSSYSELNLKNEASRMTASQMPKNEDYYIGKTVKPGKIKPWSGNEDEGNFGEEDFSGRSGVCSSEGNSENDGLAVSTSNPVNLRVIGLVSMNQASSTSTGDSDTNYEIVPLVHVKIEQQAENTEKSPSRPVEEGCPAIEIPNSSQDSRDDQSPCSRLNEGDTGSPEVVTLNMDNDEELREPVQGGSCPGFNQKNSENLDDHSNDKADRTVATEVLSPYSRTTTAKTRLEEPPTDSRKAIRMKNMMAIVQFMKKIKELMNGDDEEQLPQRNNKDIIIKLDRVFLLPNNQTIETPNKIEQPEESTDNIVMIGEGVRHKPASNGINFEKNFRLPGIKKYNETNVPSSYKFNEIGTANKTKAAENERDKSFLFSANRAAIENSIQTNDGKSSEADHKHKIRLIEKLRNVVDSGINEENLSSESKDEKISNESESSFGAEKRMNKNRDIREDSNNSAMNKRKSTDDFSLIRKTKRQRLPIRLHSNRMRYEIRNERDAKSQIYRRRSLPTVGEVSRFSDRKFERYAAAKGIPKEKRMKKKKKKQRRRKKKKRKRKKKKKGKNHREAAVKGKAWWPFGRQLMSVSEERGLILNSNFERSQVEPVKTKRQGNRRISLPFEARKRRRVHRPKYPHKSKKKRRKHKKTGRKKKKKKMKGRDGGKLGMRSKRQIKPGGNQARGGQDCMDRRHPSNVNPEKYLESAHCLRFSDMWYSVYELEDPIMEHTVYLQLFEKHSLEDGTTHWDDLTQGTMVRMGTFTRHQRDNKPTIVFTYSGAKMESQKRALNLDPTKQRLLVPSPVSPKKSSQYPEAKSELGEYLVVQTNTISKDGNDCDKAGVGFAAFSKQEDRCGRAKGSCLRNQPLAYWRHDTEARESGRPGCYFLSNFATVPTNPIKYNVSGTGSREYLGLEYHSAHVSAIDIEVRTDYNAIVRVGSSGRVTEVYVDSTALEHTVVTVVISNMGLASSPYQPRITDCPTGLPVSWTKAKGIMQVIPPQHDQRVTLDLYGQLLINGFHCSVEVINHRGELVAMRRIRVQKMDRCFCVWHCLCACIGSVSGMGCQPMSPEHYHAAGFQGPVPVVTTETSILMNAVKDVLMLSALLILLLLLLGMLKWFVGMFVPAVGRWGLDTLLDGSRIEKYLEPELQCRCVVTDDDGAPVHPDTGERTVRICSRKLEFFLNLIFFLTYPIAVCCGYFRKSLNASRQRNCCPDESKMCLINEKGSCPKMICVSSYGDSKNSKLEAEDTRYVMNELKKSQESLEHPRRTKKKEGHGKNLEKKSSRKNKSALDVAAKKFVDQLLKKRMVFRNLNEPIGGLVVPAGISYSLRGYFLNAENGGFRFITPCPFKQHWLIVNNQKKASKPPEIYPSNQFMRLFISARDVYESNELSLTPQGICLNVQYFEHN